MTRASASTSPAPARASTSSATARRPPRARVRRLERARRRGAAALAGGHLGVVLHATRSTSLPRRRDRRDPRAHARADRDPRLGRVARPCSRRRSTPSVADVLLLPQLTENVVFAIRKAAHAGRRHVAEGAARGRHGQIVTVFSPKGGTGKTVTATNLAAAFAKYEQQAHAAARPRPPVRRRRDHARARAREDDLRPRRRPGRARHREARGLHRPSTRAGSTSCRRRCARRTPSSSPRRSSPACSRSRASRTT